MLHVGRLISGKNSGTRHPEIVTEVTLRHHREEQIAIAASVKIKIKVAQISCIKLRRGMGESDYK